MLRLYSKPYYERFGEGMEQTFSDLLRERRDAGRGVFAFVAWMFVETSAAIARENLRAVAMKNKNVNRIALATVALLLIPLVAMQFSDEMKWGPGDFVFAGALLFGAGLAFELIAKRSRNMAYRLAVGLAVATAFILIWANLAVGIIGSEDNSANVMYLGVLVVGVVGAIVARFRPEGMARALYATAIAQLLVPVIALTVWRPRVTVGALEVFGLNALFVAMFVASALLFRRAGQVPRAE